MGQLMTRLNFPLQMDYIHASRYRGDTSGGVLKWLVKPSFELKDRVVVIVDDVLDKGITLAELIKYCRQQGAREVYSAVLVEKIQQRPFDIESDFTGIKTVDRYLFGYGMDYKTYLRNAEGIYAVKGM
jgi:hypoxanthine phosphoribosyltransferase